MIRRRRSCAERPLRFGEGFVEDEAARHDRAPNRGEQIPLQVSRHDDEVERVDGQRIHRQIGAPAADGQPACAAAATASRTASSFTSTPKS